VSNTAQHRRLSNNAAVTHYHIESRQNVARRLVAAERVRHYVGQHEKIRKIHKEQQHKRQHRSSIHHRRNLNNSQSVRKCSTPLLTSTE